MVKLGLRLRTALKDQGLLEETHKGIRLAVHLYHPLMMTWVSDHNSKNNLKVVLLRVFELVPIEPKYNWDKTDWHQERALRYKIYLSEFADCQSMLALKPPPHPSTQESSSFLVNLCFYPFDQAFFTDFPAEIRYQAFVDLLTQFRLGFKDNTEVIELLQSLVAQGYANNDMQALLAEQYLLMADLDKAQKLLSGLYQSAYVLALSGWLKFAQGDTAGAIGDFEGCKKAKNKIQRRKHQYIGGMAGLFHLMALLQLGYDNNPEWFNRIEAEIDAYSRAENQLDKVDITAYWAIKQVGEYLNDGEDALIQFDFVRYEYNQGYYFQLSLLFSALGFYWAQKTVPTGYFSKLCEFFDLALAANNLWYARTTGQLLQAAKVAHQPAEDFLQQHTYQGKNLVELINKKAGWDSALDVLIAMKQEAKWVDVPTNQTNKQSRLIWLLHDPDYIPYFEAKEQKMGKNGWSKGRVVALKRLCEQLIDFDYISEHDKRMIKAIDKTEAYGYYRKETFELSGYFALRACINHPQIYLNGHMEQSIEVVEREPGLLISKLADGYLLQMPGTTEAIRKKQNFYRFEHDTGQRYWLVYFSSLHQRIAEVMGENGLHVPEQGKQKVLDSIAAVAPLLNIQSDIAGIGEHNSSLTQVDPDNTLYIDIQPSGPGLLFECYVRPLGEGGPTLIPGRGSPTIVAQIGNEQCTVTRDLETEQGLLEPLRASGLDFDGSATAGVMLDDLETELNALEALHQLQHHDSMPPMVLKWPKGKALTLTKTTQQQQMQLSLGKQKDWFSLDGELTVDDQQVIDLKQLLLLLEGSPGRFIALTEDKFLVLTAQLRQQLDSIASATHNGRFHPLAAPMVEQAIQGMTVKSHRAWQQQVKRLKESFLLEVKLPSTLQAQLRDYQQTGYDWASRLAHWGGGACLADDMGLGKTVQALAVIVARAEQGPSLVLAPTSVCFNWQDEARRFAPTLSVKMLGEGNKTERLDQLDNAQPFDLIICSYGLLQSLADQLAKVKWHTLVADEAQAIKNPQAKRAKLALTLDADFKLITTGTPIENNLSELWSLFEFINPGLLGTQKAFNKRFAEIIENNDEDPAVRKHTAKALRQLISPFILRRLKSEVLTELPSRTEINLHVTLSEQEAVFYEALRQKAVETILASDNTAGQKRIKILAEIMRLRRACCHPTLVLENCDIPSAKLHVFDQLIDELKQGNHKALVFSQFIGHLAILRQHLEQKGITFEYLDGSTTPADRKKAVQAFQSGHSDLFLISLKAGGTGLNLTAADYVIHMDPWWNPAVEDQASDRAHRMGQTRPVTIYRLICQNTIEEKIVALHQQKRDLANSLLEGTQSSGNMSFEEMMNLLQEQ